MANSTLADFKRELMGDRKDDYDRGSPPPPPYNPDVSRGRGEEILHGQREMPGDEGLRDGRGSPLGPYRGPYEPTGPRTTGYDAGPDTQYSRRSPPRSSSPGMYGGNRGAPAGPGEGRTGNMYGGPRGGDYERQSGYPPSGPQPGYPPSGPPLGYPPGGPQAGYPPSGPQPGYPPMPQPEYLPDRYQPGYPTSGPQPGYPPSGPQPGYPPIGPQPGYPSSGPYGAVGDGYKSQRGAAPEGRPPSPFGRYGPNNGPRGRVSTEGYGEYRPGAAGAPGTPYGPPGYMNRDEYGYPRPPNRADPTYGRGTGDRQRCPSCERKEGQGRTGRGSPRQAGDDCPNCKQMNNRSGYDTQAASRDMSGLRLDDNRGQRRGYEGSGYGRGGYGQGRNYGKDNCPDCR